MNETEFFHGNVPDATRSKRLSVNDERPISRVEKFGCEVIQVTGTETSQGWSYTVGIYDTCGQPEVIAVGLPEKTALFLLNEAARRLRQGIALTEGRQSGMVGEVSVSFVLSIRSGSSA